MLFPRLVYWLIGKEKNQRWRIKKIPIYQLQVTLKESVHSRCWLFQNSILINCTTTYKKICSTLWKNVYKCIKVSKSNNYKDLCIRHTFVKREFLNFIHVFSKAIYIPIFRFSLLRMCFPSYHTCRIIIFCFKACIFRLVIHT